MFGGQRSTGQRLLARGGFLCLCHAMSGKPRPSPCYLDDFKVWKVANKQRIWRNEDGTRFYTWDSLHGEIEVFNKRGHHLGALDGTSGTMIKTAVRGRQIDLS
jgi:hypothetical protein